MYNDKGELLEAKTVKDKIKTTDIAVAVTYVDIVSVDYGSKNAMENTLFEIMFKIRDVLVVDEDPTNDAITVECIIIDMPFYLYQGLLGNIAVENVALQDDLTATK